MASLIKKEITELQTIFHALQIPDEMFQNEHVLREVITKFYTYKSHNYESVLSNHFNIRLPGLDSAATHMDGEEIPPDSQIYLRAAIDSLEEFLAQSRVYVSRDHLWGERGQVVQGYDNILEWKLPLFEDPKTKLQIVYMGVNCFEMILSLNTGDHEKNLDITMSRIKGTAHIHKNYSEELHEKLSALGIDSDILVSDPQYVLSRKLEEFCFDLQTFIEYKTK